MNSLSFSLGGSSSKPFQKRSPPPTKRANGTKRDHAALLDDASDDEDATTAKRQTITHFDTAVGGAVDAKAPKKEEKKALVISALANRDWREASKRQRAQKYGITSEQLDAKRDNIQQGAEGADKVVKETDGVKYGLNVFAPSAATSSEDTPMEQEADGQERRLEQKTADQLAVDALTGAAPTSTLTIPASAATEEDAFASSYHSAPPAPSLSDYAAIPVEEYGAAMLRGMGWKGPSSTPSAPTKNGKKALPPAKRPALLGIGADPNAAAQAEELGAWGKTSSSRKGRKEPTMFIPVSMKNKHTGETLTEDELKEKLRRDKEEAENQRFMVNDLEIRDKKPDRRNDRDDGERERRRKQDYSDDEERKRRRRDRERQHDSDRKSRDYDRNHHDENRNHDRKDRDRESRRNNDRSHRNHEYEKPSHRRDRSRDRDYDRKDRNGDQNRDYEKSSSRRDRYEDDKAERRRERDGNSHRSSRR